MVMVGGGGMHIVSWSMVVHFLFWQAPEVVFFLSCSPFFLFVSFPYLKLFSQAFLLKDGNLFCLLHVSYVWVEAKLKYSGWFDLSNYNYRLYFPHCESLRSTSLNSQKIYKIEEKNLMYKSHFQEKFISQKTEPSFKLKDESY